VRRLSVPQGPQQLTGGLWSTSERWPQMFIAQTPSH